MWALFLWCIPAQFHICSLLARNGFVLSGNLRTSRNTLIIFNFSQAAASQTEKGSQSSRQRCSLKHSKTVTLFLATKHSRNRQLLSHTEFYIYNYFYLPKHNFSRSIHSNGCPYGIFIHDLFCWCAFYLSVPTTLIPHLSPPSDLPLKVFSGNSSFLNCILDDIMFIVILLAAQSYFLGPCQYT